MKTTKPCRMCNGKKTLRIADYVDKRVIPDLEIKCPACDGKGEIETDDAAAKSVADDWIPLAAAPKAALALEITFSRVHEDVQAL
jgi:hypothetical protein